MSIGLSNDIIQIKTEAPSDAAWQQPPPINISIPERDPTRYISIEAYNNLPKSSDVNLDALKIDCLRFSILKEIEETPEVWKKEIAVNTELAKVAVGVYSRTGMIFNVPTIRNVFTVAKQRLKARLRRALQKSNVLPPPEQLENILWESYGADYGAFRFYRARLQRTEQKWRKQLLTGETIVLSDDGEEIQTPADLGRRRSGGLLEAQDGPATERVNHGSTIELALGQQVQVQLLHPINETMNALERINENHASNAQVSPEHNRDPTLFEHNLVRISSPVDTSPPKETKPSGFVENVPEPAPNPIPEPIVREVGVKVEPTHANDVNDLEAENAVEPHAPEENMEYHQPSAPALTEQQSIQAGLIQQSVTNELARVIQENPARMSDVYFSVISLLQDFENARPEQTVSDVLNDLTLQWKIWENQPVDER